MIRETGHASKGLVAVTALRSGEVIVPGRLLELHTGVSMQYSCLGHRWLDTPQNTFGPLLEKSIKGGEYATIHIHLTDTTEIFSIQCTLKGY